MGWIELTKTTQSMSSKAHSTPFSWKTVLLWLGPDLDLRTCGWSDYICVYDNEPRSREIVKRSTRPLIEEVR